MGASTTTSTTAAGPPPKITEELIDTINQVFALFRLNYHNQFYSAYPDNEQLSHVKKLWLEALAPYPSRQILLGARRAIETSEYLPTLHRMLESCHSSLEHLGLPAPRAAYQEACQAPSPRAAHAWSHAAVYLAGRDSDWFFLTNTAEKQSWPVFREHYQRYCTRVLAGETLELPTLPALTQEHSPLSSRDEALSALEKIKQQLSD
ncbi:hypothetical protein EYC98_18040 [Halieaceae bacterium IMCC14734]|uniref:Replicative helicase inhibitor G39P N-terminal domain-containing protein n=1 Tax=Candidatus Litorirhabdus singularis TaxID=2518993 RepID=A0ABT3TKB4_9GAMM|nr:hypothetical protein [Candidatus Litorirhabdus singularis]